MRHARRLGAVAIASSVSLLTTIGVAEAIRSIEDPGTPTAAGTQVAAGRTAAGKSGPSRLLVIRRATPAQAASSGGTIYVQASATTTTTAPVAQAPAAPTTSSS